MYIMLPASAMTGFLRIEGDLDELHIVAKDFVVDFVASQAAPRAGWERAAWRAPRCETSSETAEPG
jgi:hypothetical protein